MVASKLANKLDSLAEEAAFSALPLVGLKFYETVRPQGFRFTKHSTHLEASINGKKILACGEADEPQEALDKAYSELIERAALIAFGANYNARTSNGWAAHLNHELCRESARLELVERDAVLAHWFSKTPFKVLPSHELPLSIQEWSARELSRTEFPILRILISTEGLGPSITCVLINHDGFGVSAHATRKTLESSIRAAITEACRAAHSAIRREHWQDALKLRLGTVDRGNPCAHGLYYAYQESFPDWMFGGNTAWAIAEKYWNAEITHLLVDARFTYHPVLTFPRAVGFVTHPEAIELFWGNTDPHLTINRLKLDEINTKPHIVS